MHYKKGSNDTWPAVAAIGAGLQIRGCLELFRDVAVQFADHLVDGFFPRGVRILGVGDGVVKLVQGDLSHLQESVWNLWNREEGGGGWTVLLSEINLINILLIVSRHSTCESVRSLLSQSKTYEMKTCSALLQTLKLMKGSCSLCSLHIYNE